jgi:hypothetical protein
VKNSSTAAGWTFAWPRSAQLLILDPAEREAAISNPHGPELDGFAVIKITGHATKYQSLDVVLAGDRAQRHEPTVAG